MRMTDEEFTAEVFRRSADYRANRKRRTRHAVTACAIAGLGVLAGFAARGITQQNLRQPSDSNNAESAETYDGVLGGAEPEAAGEEAQEDALIAGEGITQGVQTEAAGGVSQIDYYARAAHVTAETDRPSYPADTAEITLILTNHGEEPLNFRDSDVSLVRFDGDAQTALPFAGDRSCCMPQDASVRSGQTLEWTVFFREYGESPLPAGDYAVTLYGLEARFTIEQEDIS